MLIMPRFKKRFTAGLFKLIANDELGSWCLKGQWVAKCNKQRGGIHGNPGRGSHQKKRPLTGTVTLKNAVEILTWKNTYLKNTYETTNHPAGWEERERESATIRKKAQLICYDQQAKQQSTTMLATNPQRALQVPKGPPHMSRTAIGDNRWLTRSSST